MNNEIKTNWEMVSKINLNKWATSEEQNSMLQAALQEAYQKIAELEKQLDQGNVPHETGTDQ